MGLPPIDDMHIRNGKQCIQAGYNLGNHASTDNAFLDKLPGLSLIQFRDQRSISAADTCYITEKNEFLRIERTSQMSGYGIGIDIQTHSIRPLPKWRYYRNVALIDQRSDWCGIDGIDLAHKPQAFVGYMRMYHVAIGSTQANGTSSHLRYHQHQALVHLAQQDHPHNLQGRSISNSQPIFKASGHIQFVQPLVDIWT